MTKIAENGTLVAYHGTFSNIDEFQADKMGFGFLGKGFYFTNSKEDATHNYANLARFTALTGIDPVEKFGNSGLVITADITLHNPLIIGGKEPTSFKLHDGSLHRFLASFMDASNDFPEISRSGIEYMGRNRFRLEASASPSQSLTAEDIIDLVSMQLCLDTEMLNGSSATSPKMSMLQKAFLNMGYDGIIYHDVKKRFGKKMLSIEKDTKHFVVFKPENVQITNREYAADKKAADAALIASMARRKMKP